MPTQDSWTWWNIRTWFKQQRVKGNYKSTRPNNSSSKYCERTHKTHWQCTYETIMASMDVLTRAVSRTGSIFTLPVWQYVLMSLIWRKCLRSSNSSIRCHVDCHSAASEHQVLGHNLLVSRSNSPAERKTVIYLHVRVKVTYLADFARWVLEPPAKSPL